MSDGRLLTINEAALALGVHYQTLRAWADSGKVPMVKLPSGYRRFEPAVIAAMRREMGYRDGETIPRKPPGRPRSQSGSHPPDP